MKLNLEKYKAELASLIERGNNLELSMQRACNRKEFDEILSKNAENEIAFHKILKMLPDFKKEYQKWYSEAHAVIKQLIPDRLSDFVRLYEKQKNRKEMTYENYVIDDYLHSLLRINNWGETTVSPKAAISKFDQQIAILESAQARFESSLFDIKQLVQADLLDSEIDAARLLLKNKFYRAAGAIAGVVIEKHLAQVCSNHNITLSKKYPTISDFNDLLKNGNIIDVPQWRFVQRLGDLRNLCDHNKDKEPTNDDINDLINGTEKITKTLF